MSAPRADSSTVSPGAPTALLDTHPVVGLAQFEAYWEQDRTGDWPGERLYEILSHTYERGRCDHCGALERRHTIRSRILRGVNTGTIVTDYWQRRTCWRCPGGSGCLSNHRRPW